MKPKNVKYTLQNTFHHTEVSFIAPCHPDGAFAAYAELCHTEYSAHKDSIEYQQAHTKLLRIKRTLCGMADCHCGGMIRGVA